MRDSKPRREPRILLLESRDSEVRSALVHTTEHVYAGRAKSRSPFSGVHDQVEGRRLTARRLLTSRHVPAEISTRGRAILCDALYPRYAVDLPICRIIATDTLRNITSTPRCLRIPGPREDGKSRATDDSIRPRLLPDPLVYFGLYFVYRRKLRNGRARNCRALRDECVTRARLGEAGP